VARSFCAFDEREREREREREILAAVLIVAAALHTVRDTSTETTTWQ